MDLLQTIAANALIATLAVKAVRDARRFIIAYIRGE